MKPTPPAFAERGGFCSYGKTTGNRRETDADVPGLTPAGPALRAMGWWDRASEQRVLIRWAPWWGAIPFCHKMLNDIRLFIDTHGGGGGIRTHGRLAPSPVFKTGAIDRSATPPAPSVLSPSDRRPRPASRARLSGRRPAAATSVAASGRARSWRGDGGAAGAVLVLAGALLGRLRPPRRARPTPSGRCGCASRTGAGARTPSASRAPAVRDRAGRRRRALGGGRRPAAAGARAGRQPRHRRRGRRRALRRRGRAGDPPLERGRRRPRHRRRRRRRCG